MPSHLRMQASLPRISSYFNAIFPRPTPGTCCELPSSCLWRKLSRRESSGRHGTVHQGIQSTALHSPVSSVKLMCTDGIYSSIYVLLYSLIPALHVSKCLCIHPFITRTTDYQYGSKERTYVNTYFGAHKFIINSRGRFMIYINSTSDEI
ncbi:hypothetical protein GGR58DRAFT_454886 [Xylaria digitata]|nr:hypothetical protein GGR58DRAFT_454886 [Xylaria digitata]